MSTKENREVKNSVFVDLFYYDETAVQNDISLYNALHDEPLAADACIQRFKIENVMYMNIQNDISFEADKKLLIFGEHQATINKNMPLRSLEYAGRAYEMLIPHRDRYKKEIVKIPKPEFYTFYNGTETWGKELELKLSDAFLVPDTDHFLELKVKVININPKVHHPILDRCPILREYGELIDTIRSYQKQGIEEPYQRSIDECMKRGILKEYLERKGGEVVGFFQAKYDYDLDIEVQREEAEKLGEQRGEQHGRLKEIFSSVQEGDYSVERGAQKASLSVDEFENAMKQAGYHIPAET